MLGPTFWKAEAVGFTTIRTNFPDLPQVCTGTQRCLTSFGRYSAMIKGQNRCLMARLFWALKCLSRAGGERALNLQRWVVINWCRPLAGEDVFFIRKPKMRDPVFGPKYLIVGVMKNEGPYILEWVAHHLSVGFDGFLIFTNDCDDGTDLMLERLGQMGIVQHVPNPKQLFPNRGNLQVMALRYARLFPQYKAAEWIYSTDADEFLNIKCAGGTLDDFFAKVGSVDVVSFTSIPFSSNDQKGFKDEFVTKQFTRYNRPYKDLKKRSKEPVHTAIKTMLRNDVKFDLRRNHRPLLSDFSRTGKVWINGSGVKMSDEFVDGKSKAVDSLTSTKFAQMNHYAIKSKDGFLIKVVRGDAVVAERLGRSEQYWNAYDTAGDDVETYAKKSKAFLEIYERLSKDDTLKSLHAAACEYHKQKVRDILETPEGKTLAKAIGYFD